MGDLAIKLFGKTIPLTEGESGAGADPDPDPTAEPAAADKVRIESSCLFLMVFIFGNI